MVEKEYNLEFATSMVHQFMPGFSSQKNAIILCDSGYIKQNFDTYNSLTPNWYYKVLR